MRVPRGRLRRAVSAGAAALFAVLLLTAPTHPAATAADRTTLPYESAAADAATPRTALDVHVLAALRAKGIEPAPTCSDGVFLRRVHLDLIGALPGPAETAAFLADRSPGKRAALVERLFARPEFAEYWALRWCDALRVKSEFPVNLWPNAVQAYHRWVHDAVRDNMPYDRFATALLTSSGSNFRVPPVNFHRGVQGRDAASYAAAAALTFMGTRTALWPETRRRELSAFFSRIVTKPTREWKEEIVLNDPSADTPLDAVLPDGTRVRIAAGDDPRRAFAAWLVAPENPWFAKAAANRVWAWIFGRGIVHEPDDLRADNPPSNPALLAHLEREFVLSGYDLRHLIRTIVNSRTYQQSPVPRSDHPDAAALFASYPLRRLDAEVLADALVATLGGDGEQYSSIIPEPFTFLPVTDRTIALADGSITSRFLETFGRPSRDTGLFSERRNDTTDAQRLHLLNATEIQRRIERSPRVRSALEAARGDRTALVREIYVAVLSRTPEPGETEAALRHFTAGTPSLKPAADDLTWALLNSKEFLHRH